MKTKAIRSRDVGTALPTPSNWDRADRIDDSENDRRRSAVSNVGAAVATSPLKFTSSVGGSWAAAAPITSRLAINLLALSVTCVA